jgi:uncharacterized protein (TIGR03435 family)
MKKLMLCVLALAAFFAGNLRAQDATGTWQGTIPFGKGLRTVVKISKDDNGLKVVLYSIDQGGQPIPATSASLTGSTLKFDIIPLGAVYEGKLSGEGKTITGMFTQGGQPFALTFTLATPETAWTIQEPPAKLPPMAKDADPAFEVATIKPSNPDASGKYLRMPGRHLQIHNFSLVDLIGFSYGLQFKQMMGLPAWAETDKYDIDGPPDKEGRPNDAQMKAMIQKLVAERFGLKFHRDKKEMPVFALTVTKAGPKLTKSDSTSNQLEALYFNAGAAGGLVLAGKNASMADLCATLQQIVLDRPVPDQTGIQGRFDFNLTFTPDDSQMVGMPMKLPPPPDNAEAPPPLFKAIQDQLGLKLEATKAPVEVIVIDHVERPSGN